MLRLVSSQKPLKHFIASLFCNFTESFYSFFSQQTGRPVFEFPPSSGGICVFPGLQSSHPILLPHKRMAFFQSYDDGDHDFCPALESGFRNVPGPGQAEVPHHPWRSVYTLLWLPSSCHTSTVSVSFPNSLPASLFVSGILSLSYFSCSPLWLQIHCIELSNNMHRIKWKDFIKLH